MSEWKPIETAPAGELLWLFEPHLLGGFMFAGGFFNGRWFNNLDLREQEPTAWMPLPPYPSATTARSASPATTMANTPKTPASEAPTRPSGDCNAEGK